MVSLIVACDKTRGIGKGGTIPWDVPEDRRFFRRVTSSPGSVLVMGTKTAESLPGPLAGRREVVVSRKSGPSLEETLRSLVASDAGRIWVIGGGEIYRECLERDLVSYLYVTHIPGDHGCDVFLPAFEERFRCIHRARLTETVTRSVWIR